MKKLSPTLLIGMALSGIFAADMPSQVPIRNTQRLDSVSSVRLTHSIGHLTVEGWEQTRVEVTTIKSVKSGTSCGREKAAHELDKVMISAQRNGEELVLTTDLPHRRHWPPRFSLGYPTSFDLEYEIKIPQNARLVINHYAGCIYRDKVTGDIEVTARQGATTLMLAESGRVAIDAKSDFGTITSDLLGDLKRRFWLIGHRLAENIPSATQILKLRIGAGDIIILQARKPSSQVPLVP